MREVIMAFGVTFMVVSCMKKVEGIEEYQTNIFDVNYEGEQWFVYEDVYMYTNSFNDQLVGVKFSVPKENLSDLRPSHLLLRYQVNNQSEKDMSVELDNQGDYSATIGLFPSGTQEYCLTLSVLIIENEDSTAINSFTECKSL